jgi:hypothetical protein
MSRRPQPHEPQATATRAAGHSHMSHRPHGPHSRPLSDHTPDDSCESASLDPRVEQIMMIIARWDGRELPTEPRSEPPTPNMLMAIIAMETHHVRHVHHVGIGILEEAAVTASAAAAVSRHPPRPVDRRVSLGQVRVQDRQRTFDSDVQRTAKQSQDKRRQTTHGCIFTPRGAHQARVSRGTRRAAARAAASPAPTQTRPAAPGCARRRRARASRRAAPPRASA